jgi:hypothetical protein
VEFCKHTCGFGLRVRTLVLRNQLFARKRFGSKRQGAFPHLYKTRFVQVLLNLFKGAAVVASIKAGPFAEFYAALLAKGMRPEMARLTLARKIVTIVLIAGAGTLPGTLPWRFSPSAGRTP